jgi:hypothetical protein
MKETPESGIAPGIAGGGAGVSIRRFPFPYRAMLGICSDLDGTPDRRTYWETMRYLNTRDFTAMGDGLALEVGNTIYFDMPRGQFSYWNTDDAGRDMIRTMIRSGHVDCLHSFGDLAATRAHAGRALDELTRHDCDLEVWIDHAVAPSNFGADIMCGSGDVPGAKAYHSDLTCGFGIRYVWRGRVTSVIGQETPRSLRGIWNRRHPVVSGKTVAKEGLKAFMGRVGSAKYSMHAENRVLRDARLRDGRSVVEFIRSNPHWGGVSSADNSDGLADVLDAPMLDTLVDREGVCLLYTHMGKIRNGSEPLPLRTRKALNRLSGYSREGKVLVTTTRRILGYSRATGAARLSVSTEGENTRIEILADGKDADGASSSDDLNGFTLYVSDPERVRVRLNGRPVHDLIRNGPDHKGLRSVSLPWRPLVFPHQ